MSEPSVTETEIKKILDLSIGRKSIVVALILWFFLGFLGVHRIYLGKTTSGIIMAIMTIVGWVTALVFIGVFILLAVSIWWVVDFIVIIVAASKHNQAYDDLTGK